MAKLTVFREKKGGISISDLKVSYISYGDFSEKQGDSLFIVNNAKASIEATISVNDAKQLCKTLAEELGWKVTRS